MTPYEQALAALAKQADRVLDPAIYYVRCNQCDILYPEDDTRWANDDRPYCEACFEELPATLRLDPDMGWDDTDFDRRREEA
jgi:hypothetical protein